MYVLYTLTNMHHVIGTLDVMDSIFHVSELLIFLVISPPHIFVLPWFPFPTFPYPVLLFFMYRVPCKLRPILLCICLSFSLLSSAVDCMSSKIDKGYLLTRKFL